MAETNETTIPTTTTHVYIVLRKSVDDESHVLIHNNKALTKVPVDPIANNPRQHVLQTLDETFDAIVQEDRLQKLFGFQGQEEKGELYEYHLPQDEEEESPALKPVPHKELAPWLDDTTDHTEALRLYLQRRQDLQVNRRLLHGYSSGNLDEYALRPKPQVVFFDCDDCLYFDGWTTAKRLSSKINEWCVSHGLRPGQAYELYKKYGTALKGLRAEGYIEDTETAIDEFLETVHDISVDTLLQPDPALREMILRMDPSIPRYVFTASVHHHAERCLQALGIADLFVDIIDCKRCELETKHSVHSFQIAMRVANVEDPESCVFLDDSTKNIEAARAMGWRSVLVGTVGRDCGQKVSSDHAELEIDRIHDMEAVLPELFVQENNKEEAQEKDAALGMTEGRRTQVNEI